MSIKHYIRKYWYNHTIRSNLSQLIFFITIISFFIYILHNASTNLKSQGIASGFDFLWQPSGFDISMHLISYNEQSSYARAFLVGLVNTILVSACGIIIATILGFIIGIARISKNFLVRTLATWYIEIFRNIPLLLQIFFWYFAVLRNLPPPTDSLTFLNTIFLNIRGLYLPTITLNFIAKISILGLAVFIGIAIFIAIWQSKINNKSNTHKKTLIITGTILFLLLNFLFLLAIINTNIHPPIFGGFNFSGGIVITPELSALLLALSIYTAAFIAEIVRAGLIAVPKGQYEAAKALGLKNNTTLQKIIIPQAMRIIIPPLTSQYLNLTKNSSLAAAIAYPDLVSVFAGTTLNQTGQAIEVISITMLVYLSLSLCISIGMNLYNRKVMLQQ